MTNQDNCKSTDVQVPDDATEQQIEDSIRNAAIGAVVLDFLGALLKKIMIGAVVALILMSVYSGRPLIDAEQATSSSKALAIVTAAIPECNDNVLCFWSGRLHDARRRYFLLAATDGDPVVLRDLYESPLFVGFGLSYDKKQRLRAELKDNVLKNAQTSTDADLLVAAASIYSNDELGVVNTIDQIKLLERAWQAGDDVAAGHLARAYVRRKDFESAYLWSLRCVNRCQRGDFVRTGENANQIQLRHLEEHLTAKQTVALQQAALIESRTVKRQR